MPTLATLFVALCVATTAMLQVNPQARTAAQKPVHVTHLHTEGGPGTPATLQGLWDLADLVAVVQVVTAQPGNQIIATADGTHTDVKTLFVSNVAEMLKSQLTTPPASVDIELQEGTIDRGDYIEEVRNDRVGSLVVGGRYVVFLRYWQHSNHYLPVTADANSFFQLSDTNVSTLGDSDLARSLAAKTPAALIAALQSLEGGRP